jgi:DNA-binding SARP family transcriptional activator
MRVGLLGPLELEAGSPALSPRDRLVLAALAMRRGQWMAADALADALWPDRPPASWVKVVQGCVSRLRRTLGPESIETSPSGYRLRPEWVDLDVVELEDLVARARSGLAEGASERAVASFEKALGLWRGRPLTELEEWPPAQLEAARLTELHLAAQEERLAAMMAAGRHHEVVAEALVQAREQPWREGRWVTLALAQYRCGRQADALASIRSSRRMLGQQLGLDPGSELADLERAILEQSPSLAADHEVRAASAACPWRGLASYDAEDVDTFFGREDDVAACLVRLTETPLLVLAGPSGSGKSSLMKAGLVPALLLQGRSSMVCTPGADPVGAIAAARVGGAQPGAVLCVDQAEEAFETGRDDDVLAWLQALADHVTTHGPVVLTLRADHLPALALDPEFARLAERGLYLVSPLSDDQLRRVIEEPARVAGLRLEHGLVDLMLRDAEHQPGAMPLLAHALSETWRRRDGSLLTVDGYRDSGGISGAVAASADRVYADLSDEQRGQLRWLMLRMAGLADAGEPVRTPVGRAVALADPDRARVLDLLVRTRLVTSDEGSFELAHEALVRAWPRLRGWLEEDRVAQRVWRHLAVSASEWEGLGRVPSELYSGVRLAAALEWSGRPESMPTEQERAFLEASRARTDEERLALAAQARRERRQNRRLRGVLAGAVALLVAATTAGALAVGQKRTADTQRDAASDSAAAARHESLVGRSVAARSTDRAVAALLAVEAYRARPDDPLSEEALLGTFTDANGFMGYRPAPFGYPVVQGDTIPGTSSAVMASGSRVAVVDLETGRVGKQFDFAVPENDDQSIVSVSADGSRVADVVFDPQLVSECGSYDALLGKQPPLCTYLTVFDIATGQAVFGPVHTPFTAGDVALDADGRTVAIAGGKNGDLATYDVDSGRLLGRLASPPRPRDRSNWRDTGAVVFSDRRRVFLGSMAGPIRKVDARTLRVLRTFPTAPMSSHNFLRLTPSGLLVTGGDDALTGIDVATGAQRWVADLTDDPDAFPCGYALTVAPQLDTFYCASGFGQVTERNLTTGALTGRHLDSQHGEVTELAVAHGNELVTFVGGYARWRLDGTSPVARFVSAGAATDGYDDSGHLLTVAELDYGKASLVDTRTGVNVLTLGDGETARWLGDDSMLVFNEDHPHRTEFLDVATGQRHKDDIAGNSYGVFRDQDGDGRAWVTNRRPRESGNDIVEVDVRTGDPTGRHLPIPAWADGVTPARDGRSVWVTNFLWRPGWNLSYTSMDNIHKFDRLDLDTGQVLDRVEDGAFGVISNRGQIVTTDNYGTIVERDSVTLQPMAKLAGSQGPLEQLAFSPDGSLLLASGDEGIVQLYDTDTWTRLALIPSAAPEGINEGWLRPDGKAVAVNTEHGVVEWTLEPDRLAAAACVMAGRNLTRPEWATYLPDQRYRRTCPDYPAGT